MRLLFEGMAKEVIVLNLEKQSRNIEDQTFEVNLIENFTSEHDWCKPLHRKYRSLEIDCKVLNVTTIASGYAGHDL